ncbi:TPA: hypothetical protein KRE82_003600 [Clostridioides difficile]|nr:hypothetical protein [Clostridioides difficile]
MANYIKISKERNLSLDYDSNGNLKEYYLLTPTAYKFLSTKKVDIQLYMELRLRSYWGNKTYANKKWHSDEPYRYIYKKSIKEERQEIMDKLDIKSPKTFNNSLESLVTEGMLKETIDSKGNEAYLFVAHENLTDEDFKNGEDFKSSRIIDLENKQDEYHQISVEYGNKSTNNNVDEMNNQARYIMLPLHLYKYITRHLTPRQCKLYLKIRAYTLHAKNKYYQKNLANICEDIGVTSKGKQMQSQVSTDLKQLKVLGLIDLKLVTFTNSNYNKTRIYRAETIFSDKLPTDIELDSITVDIETLKIEGEI